VVVGGRFRSLAGITAKGLGAVDAVTGRARAFAANQVVQDYGPGASITSLSTDGRLVYGTGYAFGGGNFEGTFAAEPTTGRIVWLEDCHGDTYGAAAAGGVVYTVGHAHSCTNIGGFPETSPRSWHRALAFTTAAKGTVAANTEGKYASFEGQPAPKLLTWWPDLANGTATGQNQAAWAVSATSSYVVLGGEFPRVNGKRQQGLVRFAVRALAPNKVGPYQSGDALGLSAQVRPDGSVQLTWNRTWDRDNERLTYTLLRTGVATPITRRAASSTFWRLGTLTATDPDTTPGSRTYRLTVTDPLGNAVTSSQLVVPAGPPAP
jgi:hypothetical protein